MKKLIVICTALFVLGAAATAYAALNTYTGVVTLTSKKPGTSKKPVSLGFKQVLTAASSTTGDRTALLLDIKTKVYGVKSNWGSLPTCSVNTITAAHADTGCPKKAKVASGAITALLGSSTDFTASGTACDPDLDVWNAGKGKLAFFFVDTATHACGSLQTGATPAYPGTYSQSGKDLVINVPIPKVIDYPVTGVAGSLTSETLSYGKGTVKVKGKTEPLLAGVGCTKGKRPYSTEFTATLPTTGQTESKTVTGSASCS